jgi:tryptophanyl-tRNA synthetase
MLDDPAELDRVLASNAAKADEVADRTLGDVYDRVGLLRRV